MVVNSGVGTRVLGCVALVLVLGACQRQVTVPQPEQGLLVEAETAFRAGDYARADGLYQRVGETGSSAQQEIVLARRSLIRALPGTSLHDRVEAEAFLDQLLFRFPDSTMGIGTEALLGLLPEIDSLRLSAARSLDEVARLRQVTEAARQEREIFSSFLTRASPFDPAFDVEGARVEYQKLVELFPDSLFRQVAERVLFLLSQWQRLGAIAAENEVEIQALRAEVAALSEELEQLKEIDLGRRLPD